MAENIVLIDAENLGCSPTVIKKCLRDYNRVYIVFAHLSAKLDFNSIANFTADIKNERLNFIKMDTIGKNSADFGLAFIAGQLSSTLEKGSVIEIRSKDLMFNNIISMLNKGGFIAKLVFKHPVLNNIHIEDGANKLKNDLHELILDKKDTELIMEAGKIDLFDLNAEKTDNEPLCEAELIDLNNSLEGEHTFNNFDGFLIGYNVENTVPIEIEKDERSILDEKIIQEIVEFHSENNITFSRKSRKVLLHLINIIRENKFKRKPSSCVCDDYGSETDIAKIIFNCMYLYAILPFKRSFKSYSSVISYLSSQNYLSRHFATVFVNYLCTCNLIKNSNGFIKNIANFTPIIEALENVKTQTELSNA